MSGFITERDFDAAEMEFPGIQRLYESLLSKPKTFLELVWTWEKEQEVSSKREAAEA